MRSGAGAIGMETTSAISAARRGSCGMCSKFDVSQQTNLHSRQEGGVSIRFYSGSSESS